MIGSLRHRPHQSSLGIPNSVDTIVGDSNCLCPALSLEITGTQAHHEQVREIIVDFMIKNLRPFSAYLGCDLQEYLVEGGSPLQPKTWGTDVEVLAAATLLQTPVVVYSACSTAGGQQGAKAEAGKFPVVSQNINGGWYPKHVFGTQSHQHGDKGGHKGHTVHTQTSQNVNGCGRVGGGAALSQDVNRGGSHERIIHTKLAQDAVCKAVELCKAPTVSTLDMGSAFTQATNLQCGSHCETTLIPVLKAGRIAVYHISQSLTEENDPPVLRDGCLWPTVDHTYCCQFPPADSAAANTRAWKATAGRKEHCGHQLEDRTPTAVTVAGTAVKTSAVVAATTAETSQTSALEAETAADTSQTSALEAETAADTSQTWTQTSTVGSQTRKMCDRDVCCVLGCQSTRQSGNKALYSLPTKEARCKQWLQNIGRKDLLVESPFLLRKKGYRVCSSHFHSDHLVQTGNTLSLCRGAVPSLVMPGESQQKEGSDTDQPEVELDWAEDPSMHHYPEVFPEKGAYTQVKPSTSGVLQSAFGHGGHSMVLLWTADCDVDTPPSIMDYIKSEERELLSPNMMNDKGSGQAEETFSHNTVDHIKSEPAKEGEAMFESGNSEHCDTSQNMVDFIKSEPVQEEKEMRVPGNGESWASSLNSVDYIRTETIEGGVCVSGNVESMDTSPNIVNFIKSEPVEKGEDTFSSVSNESWKDFSWRSRAGVDTSGVKNSEPCYRDGREQTSLEQLERWGAVSMDVTSDRGCVDSREQLSGHGRQTTASDVLEEDDVDMTYTVVKAEPESDVEEQ
ncbi:hypothetical protein ACOMHN_003323 [Nucella lapillus]